MSSSVCSRSLHSVAIVMLLTSILVATDSCGGGDSGNHSSPPVTIAISTRPVSLNAGSTYNFVASVANSSNSSVTWKLACPAGVTDCGALGSADGVYKAPIVDSSISPTVTATSSADTSKSDSWTFQVLPLPTTIKLNNPPSWINAGMSYKFSATVSGRTNTSITWSISCSPTLSDCGSIAADGTYTSPASVAQQAPFTVTATSVADPTKSDSAVVALLPAIAIAVTPASVQMVSGFSYPFAANVQNDLGNVGVTWSVNGIAGGNATVGTIAAVPDQVSPSRLTAMYKAPVTTPAAPVTITATSLVDGNKSANSSVSFIPNPHPNFTGDFAFLLYGPQGLGSEAAGGLITLDGTGNMTGKLDVHVASFDDQVAPGLDVTGTYGFDGNDAGWATLTYREGTQSVSFQFRLVFLSDTVAKIMEFDGTGGTMGTIEKQLDFANTLNGRYVFALNGFRLSNNVSTVYAAIGQFSGSAGALTGVYDWIDTDPNHHSQALSGWYQLSGKTGTANLGVKGGTSFPDSPDFFLYPVSASRALVMSKAPPLLVGWIDKQSNEAFSNAALKGEWVFYNARVAPTLSSATVGRFSSDGLGTSAPGCIDSSGSAFSWEACYPMFDLNAYSIDAVGRGNAPQAQWGFPRPAYFYFIDANHGRFGSEGGLGEFFQVQGTPFTNSSLSSVYTIAFTGTQDYFFNAKSSNQVGIVQFDGSGNLSMTTNWDDARNFAQRQGYTRTGTYAFDSGLYATGERGKIQLSDGGHAVYYAVSQDKLLVLQSDYYDIGFGIVQKSTVQSAR